MRKIVTWVLVSDGGRARVFENDGPDRGLTELTDLAREADLEPSRDIMADRQGRTFDSAGPGRHAMERPTDPRELEEERFLDETLEIVAGHARKGRFDRLIIAAPPRALGHVRKELPRELSERLHADLPKDLTKASIVEIQKQVGTVMAV
ncbi:MAG: host attachment family protein [Alphaproteobacteria bacterium]|nr:host attachment family protein [Alphaproteobacteria bacterium]MDX5368680.1 host attachment family protein [Alphaproteobacteria bacterium]MDX5463425.1 host attachment family protein [Alphaproteobacteria bacterium]